MKFRDIDISNYDTLLLDRDGVINVHIIGDYVKCWSDFEFIPEFLDIIPVFANHFKHIFVVTNQRGIGRGVLTENNLAEIHNNMLSAIDKIGGRIDGIYYSTSVDDNSPDRKPSIGMFKRILNDYPELDTSKILMIGDSDIDMQFASNCSIDAVQIDSIKKENNQYYLVNNNTIIKTNRYMNHYKTLIERYPALEECKIDIIDAFNILKVAYENGNKLLVTGNGGSAADSEHIVGELMKAFVLPRKLAAQYKESLCAVDEEMGTILGNNLQGALPAIALDGHIALSTAYMNDCEPLLCFAQQVNGYGVSGDVFLGISTSGNSKNVLYAATVAKAKGMKVIGLTGKKESKLSKLSDVCIKVPECETYKIQEYHLPIYHTLCLMLEDYFFNS